MNAKIKQGLLGGVAATLVMIAPKMGILKMSPPEILVAMMKLPIFVGNQGNIAFNRII